MAVTPITPVVDNLRGKVITIWQDYTSGAAVNTITLATYYPYFDLNQATPVISAASILTEANTDLSESKVYDPNKNVGRGVAPDATDNEWAVQTANTIKLDTSDKDGTVMITYIAAGGQKA